MQLPIFFKDSYINFPTYPCNLLDTGCYQSALSNYKLDLDQDVDKLFAEDVPNADIDFELWDVKPACAGWSRWRVNSDAKVKELLGDKSTLNATSSQPAGDVATKKDPPCRIVYVCDGPNCIFLTPSCSFPSSDHSQASLKITRNVFARILTYHQVTPLYLDFLSAFGRQSRKRDLRYSGFREKNKLGTPRLSSVVNALGRSGRHVEMCYNLKWVGCKNPAATTTKLQEWTIRPAAIYYRFDVVEATGFWLITTPRDNFKLLLADTIGQKGRLEDRDYSTPESSFVAGLAIHAFTAQWSTDGWHRYIQWLEGVVEDDVSRYQIA